MYSPCRSQTGSPWSDTPYLDHLRRSVARLYPVEEPFFDGFSGTMGLSDCSETYMLGLRAPAFPSRTDGGTLRQSRPSSPLRAGGRLPHMERMHMQQVSDSGALNRLSRYRTSPYCLPAIASSGEFPNSGTRKRAGLPIRPTWSALPNGDFGAQYCACAFPC